MFPAGQHPMYPYTEEDRRIVLENAGLKEDEYQTGADSIKDWVEKQPHLAEAGIDSHAAGSFLIMAKGSVEKAKQRIDFYYRERARSTVEINDRIKLLEDRNTLIWDTHIIAPAPKLYKGSRVTFFKIFDWEKFNMEKIMRNIVMITDIRLSNDFTTGETWILDLGNATLGDILKLDFMELSRKNMVMRQGLGARINAIHIVNCGLSSIIQAILNMVKQFLSKKVIERVKFHESPENLREFLPNEYLVEDYGGELPSIQVFREKMEKMMTEEKTKQFLLDACRIVSDESKRVKTEYNEDCLPGNFKTLDLD